MKTLTRDGVSLYLVEDNEQVHLLPDSVNIFNADGSPKRIVADMNNKNTVIHANVTAPADWKGGKYRFDGTNWTPVPVTTVPDSVSMRQARLAMLNSGILSNADTAIAAMVSPEKEQAQIEWEYSTTVERNSPLITLLAPGLGLSDSQVDELFKAAAVL